MIINRPQPLKIHKLTQAQYERLRDAGELDEQALYLTPDIREVDIADYATVVSVDQMINDSIYLAMGDSY